MHFPGMLSGGLSTLMLQTLQPRAFGKSPYTPYALLLENRAHVISYRSIIDLHRDLQYVKAGPPACGFF
jgi:hypothetical protein